VGAGADLGWKFIAPRLTLALGYYYEGDLRAAGVVDGGIWLLDVKRAPASSHTDSASAPALCLVSILGMPLEIAFHPHGTCYSNATGSFPRPGTQPNLNLVINKWKILIDSQS